MTEEFEAKLAEYGFHRYTTNCELLSVFGSGYCYDTKMIVEGDHSSERAELVYLNKDGFEGLCYAGSLLEALIMNYPNLGVQRIIKQMYVHMDTDIELRWIGGYPMIVSPCTEQDFWDGGIEYHISDMLKVIGMLDYLLPRREQYLRKQQTKNKQ